MKTLKKIEFFIDRKVYEHDPLEALADHADIPFFNYCDYVKVENFNGLHRQAIDLYDTNDIFDFQDNEIVGTVILDSWLDSDNQLITHAEFTPVS